MNEDGQMTNAAPTRRVSARNKALKERQLQEQKGRDAAVASSAKDEPDQPKPAWQGKGEKVAGGIPPMSAPVSKHRAKFYDMKERYDHATEIRECHKAALAEAEGKLKNLEAERDYLLDTLQKHLPSMPEVAKNLRRTPTPPPPPRSPSPRVHRHTKPAPHPAPHHPPPIPQYSPPTPYPAGPSGPAGGFPPMHVPPPREMAYPPPNGSPYDPYLHRPPPSSRPRAMTSPGQRHHMAPPPMQPYQLPPIMESGQYPHHHPMPPQPQPHGYERGGPPFDDAYGRPRSGSMYGPDVAARMPMPPPPPHHNNYAGNPPPREYDQRHIHSQYRRSPQVPYPQQHQHQHQHQQPGPPIDYGPPPPPQGYGPPPPPGYGHPPPPQRDEYGRPPHPHPGAYHQGPPPPPPPPPGHSHQHDPYYNPREQQGPYGREREQHRR